MYEDKTYAALLAEGLGQVRDDILKSEGSLVYNAVSVVAYELERLYIQADYMLDQIDPETADMEHLVMLCARKNIYPEAATYAEVKLVGDAEIPVGARFNLSAFNYVVTEPIEGETFTYRARCETAGSGPNGLTGVTIPITYVPDLKTATITAVLVAGDDATTREKLLEEYKNSFENSSFSGNVAAYKEELEKFDGVGGCKVYPVWNGGGTSKGVLIGSDYRAVSAELVEEVQEAMCPTPSKGYGISAIGHNVTIVSVEEVTVNVATEISFVTGASWESCRAAIIAAVSNYMAAQRAIWDSGDENSSLTVYISRIESAILGVEGVLDVGNTALNGSATNLVLNWDEIPVLGTVTNTAT